MLWNLQNNLSIFPPFHPSVLSHRCHSPPGFASGRFHLLPSQACFFSEKARKEWVLCLANKTLPSLVLCPYSEDIVQRQFWWGSSLSIWEQDHNSLLCYFSKAFSNLVRYNLWFQAELHSLDSMVPELHKKLNPPSSYCWLCNPHSHIQIKEFFHFHAKCSPWPSVCYTSARWEEVDLFPWFYGKL